MRRHSQPVDLSYLASHLSSSFIPNAVIIDATASDVPPAHYLEVKLWLQKQHGACTQSVNAIPTPSATPRCSGRHLLSPFPSGIQLVMSASRTAPLLLSSCYEVSMLEKCTTSEI